MVVHNDQTEDVDLEKHKRELMGERGHFARCRRHVAGGSLESQPEQSATLLITAQHARSCPATCPRSPKSDYFAPRRVCPRRNSAISMRRFPSSCTSPTESASLPAAITSSLSLLKISPGFPPRSTMEAEKIFRFRSPSFINAPGHGLNARIFLSIISAGSDQSILPLSRVSFGAYVATALSCGMRGAFPFASI